MNRLILLDNTVLTNLALVQRTDLVFRLWSDDACTTSAVMMEYHAGAAQGKFDPNAWRELPVIELTEQEIEWENALSQKLGAGERSCIAIALHRQGVFVSDDSLARATAKQNGIALTGTLGILLLGVEREHISLEEGNSFLRRLIAAGYYSPVEGLNEFFKK